MSPRRAPKGKNVRSNQSSPDRQTFNAWPIVRDNESLPGACWLMVLLSQLTKTSAWQRVQRHVSFLGAFGNSALKFSRRILI
jgi:hypothetical protein